MHALSSSLAWPAVGSAFAASLVEAVEAFTIVLAVSSVRGWRPALAGSLVGLGTLTGLVALLGPMLRQVPIQALQLSTGVLLLLFGMGWLRKAILRAAGILPVRDEDAVFAAEAAEIGATSARHERSRNRVAAMAAFKAFLLEGLEVVFIVLAVGGGGTFLLPASMGALAACLGVLFLGVAVHRPLAQVPENTLKFGVGVMLSAFGVFWTGEGLGILWPGSDFAVLAFIAAFCLAACAHVILVRRQPTALPQ